jgi:hypothetical protein
MTTESHLTNYYTMTTTNQTVRFDDGAELRFPAYSHVLKACTIVYLECGLILRDWEVQAVESIAHEDPITKQMHHLTNIFMQDKTLRQILSPCESEHWHFVRDLVYAIPGWEGLEADETYQSTHPAKYWEGRWVRTPRLRFNNHTFGAV